MWKKMKKKLKKNVPDEYEKIWIFPLKTEFKQILF